MNDEIYPMPAFAQLESTDLDRAARWYTEVLGFRTIFAAPGPDGQPLLVHLRGARYQDVLLTRTRKPREPGAPVGTGIALYFQFWESWDALAALAERARAATDQGVEGPIETPWNTREVRLRDPDGFLLVFSKGPVKEMAMSDLFPNAKS
jgi:catechol 2,3-dioxygenase-like lactoylglutathione lyase family enzyme